MEYSDYRWLAMELDGSPEWYAARKKAANMRLIHAALGLPGEVGEVVDIIKKHVFGGEEIDREHLREELGDKLWYFTLLLDELNISLDEVMRANVAKLQTRYPDSRDKYTSRDTEAEKQAMREAVRQKEALQELVELSEEMGLYEKEAAFGPEDFPGTEYMEAVQEETLRPYDEIDAWVTERDILEGICSAKAETQDGVSIKFSQHDYRGPYLLPVVGDKVRVRIKDGQVLLVKYVRR